MPKTKKHVSLVSNQTLVILLSIAILVSLVSLLRVYQPQAMYLLNTLTGYGTAANATVYVEVTRTVVVSTTGTISFGAGQIYLNNSNQQIILNSTGNGGTGSLCVPGNASFSGVSCVRGDNSSNKLVVQNDGNVNLTILMDINSTSANLALGAGGDFGFLLGQEENLNYSTGGNYTYACSNETGTKNTTQLDGGGLQFPNNTGLRIKAGTGSGNGWPVSIYGVAGQSSGSSQVNICSKLAPGDNHDAINVTIYLNVSTATPMGAKNFLLNFTGVDAFTGES